MCLDALCSRAACRRARCCRGQPRDCLTRYAPLVPEEARDGVKAMLDGLQGGVDFDTLLDDAPEIEDLAEWTECVRACAARAQQRKFR